MKTDCVEDVKDIAGLNEKIVIKNIILREGAMVVLPTIAPSLQGDSRMLKHSCSEVRVMHCMT